MNHPKECPNCKIPWEAKENIYDYFRNAGETKERATEIAANYGCTKENPKHFGTNVIGVEYPGKYDGVWEWSCTNCKHVVPRFQSELPYDFDLLWDIKTLDQIERIAKGIPTHSDAIPSDLVKLYKQLNMAIPKCLESAEFDLTLNHPLDL